MIKIEERATKKMPGLSSLFITFDYNPKVLEVVKGSDVRFYDTKTHEWEIPVTYIAYLIDNLHNLDDIEIKFLKDKKEKSEIFSLSNHKINLYDYQEAGVQFGLNHDKWLLLDAPGLGKSGQAICLAEEIKKRSKIKHCLIVCGLNTLKQNWKKEIAKHSLLDCKILGERINSKGKSVIGSVKDREAELKKPIKEFFVITNIETLRENSIIKAILNGKNQFDLIIFDEVHVCKNSESQQGKNFLKLNKCKYQLGMTGTLLLNSPVDAYMPLKWLGVEKSNLSTFRTCYYNYTGPFNNVLVGYRNLDILKYQLDKYSLRRTKDILDLPPKTIIPEIVELNDKHAKFYENITNGIVEEVDKVKLTTTSLLAMVARLRQATACPSILTSENIVSSKIERAKTLCDEIISSGDKVVIFSTFKETVKHLSEALKEYNPIIATGDFKDEEISKAVDEFQNNPDKKVFIATWQKCGTGITLTAASYMIFIDTPWTSGVFNQACDRIHRIGSKNPVFIYNLICKGTIDERVYEIIESKKAIADYVIDDEISKDNIDMLKKYILDLKQI